MRDDPAAEPVPESDLVAILTCAVETTAQPATIERYDVLQAKLRARAIAQYLAAAGLVVVRPIGSSALPAANDRVGAS